MILTYIGAFLITIIIDICFTYHVIAASKHKSVEAALANSMGNLMAKSLVFLYINHPLVVLSIFIGSFVGTYLATKYHTLVEMMVDKIEGFFKRNKHISKG